MWQKLLAREQIQYMVWLTVITALVNIVGNLLFIPVMGVSGSVLASTVSYSLLAVMVVWFYMRETRLSWAITVPRWNDLRVYFALWNRYARVLRRRSQVA